METTINIKNAVPSNLEAVCRLLAEENLPTIDINPSLGHFFIALDGSAITGVIGMDKYGDDGLLRSAIVQKAYRSTGVAAALVNQLVGYAKSQGITTLYLITNTAEMYFAKKGFTKITREAVPGTVLQSKEFNGLCPASSSIMYRKL